MTEQESRQIAFGIVTNHPNCLQDDEPLDALIRDIAHAIHSAFHARPIEFEYTNWEGRKSMRSVQPINIRFGKSDWHPSPQWLMRAFDIDKGEEREFAMNDMEFEEDTLAPIPLTSR